MGHVQRARTELRTCSLNEDFARDFVARRFGIAVRDALYECIPVISSGPRRGKLRGYVIWIKCTEGGWWRPLNGNGLGRVLKRGAHRVQVCIERDPLSQCWLDEWSNATDEMRIAALRRLNNEQKRPRAADARPAAAG